VHYLENKVLDIVDARCNHEVHYLMRFYIEIISSIITKKYIHF